MPVENHLTGGVLAILYTSRETVEDVLTPTSVCIRSQFEHYTAGGSADAGAAICGGSIQIALAVLDQATERADTVAVSRERVEDSFGLRGCFDAQRHEECNQR